MSDHEDGPRLSLLRGSAGGEVAGTGVPEPDASIAFHTLGVGSDELDTGIPPRPVARPSKKAHSILPVAPTTEPGRRTGITPIVTRPQNPVDAAEEILRSAARVSAGAASLDDTDLQDGIFDEGSPRDEDSPPDDDSLQDFGLSEQPVTLSIPRAADTWRSVAGRVLTTLVLADLLTVVGTTWVVIAIVSVVKGHNMLVHTTILAAVLGALGWTAMVAFMGGYSVRRPGFRGGALREAFNGSAVILGILASLRALWGVGLPVAAILFVPLVTLVLGGCGRLVVRRRIRRARGQGRWLTRALVVSTNGRPEALVDRLDQRTGHGMSIVGICTDHGYPGTSTVPVLGGVDDTCDVALRLAIDVVVIDCDDMSPDQLRQLLWKIERDELAAVIAPPMGEIDPSRISIMPTMDSTLMGVRLGSRLSGWIVKSMFDRVVGTLLLCLLSPVLLVSGIAVAVSSRGPVFFRQVRVGQDGNHFTMWKFRSMYVDAEERKAALVAASDGAGLLFKMKDDPRVTSAGKVLRRYSIDELPQLFNVVLGQMALVGPRPALPQEVAEYDWSVSQRLKVRPGMTGLWQVSGRSNLSWEESVRLDLRYADNWSIRMDLAILWATVGAVFGGEGAY